VALEVGGVFARLGARLDEDGFDRYDRRLDKARRDARRPVVTELDVKADTRGLDNYQRGLKAADRSQHDMIRGSGRLKTSMGALFIGGAGVAAGATAFYGLARAGKSFISTASDISESLSKNRVLFGENAKAVEDFASRSARSYGVSKAAALQYTGTFGNLFRAFGAGQKEAADRSVALTKTAADLASFNNTTIEDALDSIRSGLVGEAEPLRKYGVTIDEAKLHIEALALAKKGVVTQAAATAKVLDPETKSLAVQALIAKQTTAAHGDFHRTQGGLANQTRILQGRLSDMGATLGAKLLPAANSAVKGINDLIDSFGKGGQGGLTASVTKAAAAIGGVLAGAFRVAGQIIGGVKRIIHDNRDTLEAIGKTVASLATTVYREFKGIVKAFSDTFGSSSGTGRDVRHIIGILLDLVSTVLHVLDVVTKRALPGIITAFRGLAQIIRGVIRIISGILSGDFGKAWDGVKDIFGGAVKAIAGILRAGTAPMRAAVNALGNAIGGTFSSVWGGIKRTAEGFINGIIDVINIIPGVNIKHVGGGTRGPGATPGYSSNRTRADRLYAGGKVTQPVAIMGEEAPQHPEWVIPTNPAYRDRAVGLWAAAARELGIPGFFAGGYFKGAKRTVSGAGDLVGDLIGKLPKPPGGLLHDTFSWVLGKAKNYIGDKAGSLFSGIGHTLGIGGDTTPVGGTLAKAAAVARRFGLSMTSGYRDPAHNAAVGGVEGSLHTHGSPGNPGAIDLVGSLAAMRQGLAYAVDRFHPREALIHDVGSGLHLHLGFFAKGGRNSWRFGRKGAGTRLFQAAQHAARRPNRGVVRSVARGERGIRNYETDIQRLEREYDQADRRYGQSDEEFLIENPDGSTTVDEGAVKKRVGELGRLEARRRAIKAKIEAYRRAIGQLIRALQHAVRRLKRALAAAKGKARAKDRQGYRERIAEHQARISELRGTHGDLELDVEDQRLDLSELANEKAAIAGTTGTPAPTSDVTDPGLGDTSTTPDSTPDAIASAPSAADIAAGVTEALASFNANRADLFSRFGSNFMLAPGAGALFAGGDPSVNAAGARYFGAFGGAGNPAAGELGGVTINNHFEAPPPDPHTWTQGVRFEVEQAIG